MTVRDYIKAIKYKVGIPFSIHSTLTLLRRNTKPVDHKTRPVLIRENFSSDSMYINALRAIPPILKGIANKNLKDQYHVDPNDLKPIYIALNVKSREQLFAVFFIAPYEGEFEPKSSNQTPIPPEAF